MALLISAQRAICAPCCGGSAGFPAFISGDDRRQFSLSMSTGATVAEARESGEKIQRAMNDREVSQSLRFDGATLVSDRAQVGLTVPVLRRSRSRGGVGAQSFGIGDIGVAFAYEVLPEWTYSALRPKGLAFLSVTLPTGSSIFDSTELYRIDSRGKGFFSFSLGVLLVKVWGPWDVAFLAQVNRSLPRYLDNPNGTLRLIPGWGVSGTASVGLSPGGGDFRLGLGLSPSFEEGVTTQGLVDGKGGRQVLFPVVFQMGYRLSEDVSLGLSYADSLLLSVSENAPLNRSVGVLLQKRFER